MIFDQVKLASKFKFFKNGEFDEFTDRLSYKFSSYILYAISGIILFKQYFAQTISCYFATDPGGNHLIAYMENYCWVQGIVPFTYQSKLPTSVDEWEQISKNKIVYYQWIPFVLIAQGIMCYLPHITWRLFNNCGKNRDFANIVHRASGVTEFDEEKRKSEVIRLAQALNLLLFPENSQQEKSGTLPAIQTRISKIKSNFEVWKKKGILLIVFYIFIKLAYFINAVGQILLMQSFLSLDKKYTFFGTKILTDIVNGKDWQVSNVFPRVGYCFAKIRQLGVTNYLTAQCVLPINMLNEKIYIFLWFWMLFLSVTTLISFLVWNIRILMYKNKTDFVKMYLKLSGDYTIQELNNKKIKCFERFFLRHDGMFILRMMASNAGDLVTAEVMSQLWKIYSPKCDDKCLNVKRIQEKCYLGKRELCEDPEIFSGFEKSETYSV